MGLDVSSHLHPVGSFDLSDHPVPTGREEVWRFTPLKRLRGLQADAALDGDDYDIKIELPAGVTAGNVEVADSERGLSGFVPTDRVAARVWAASPQVFTVDVPAETELAEPVLVTVTGRGVEPAIARQLLVKVGAHARATVVVGRHRRDRGRRRRPADLRHGPGLG
jgi:Fe-S cluster assembly protein SufD